MQNLHVENIQKQMKEIKDLNKRRDTSYSWKERLGITNPQSAPEVQGALGQNQ